MAAPSPGVRLDPVGIMLDEGYRTLITIAADTDISFWEKSVTPPGVDGGDAVDITTMHNDVWRTMRSRSLKTLTEVSCTVGYDPAVITQIVAICNVETTITITFPDGSTWAFYGYLRVFTPSENSEGDPVEADITIQPTNFDPVNHVEAGPALASVAGT